MAVGRFQVMALLQAARAYVLGLSENSAKSWGLNRAIFYAAAKRGFKKAKPVRFDQIEVPAQKFKKEEIERMEKTFGVYHLGDEMAYSVQLGKDLTFTIGGELQTPEKFEKQIANRFGDIFDKAWKEAIKICQSVDKGVLKSQRYFYETVYRPRRDELASKWTRMSQGLL